MLGMILVQSKALQDFATNHGLDLSAIFTNPAHLDMHQRLLAANAAMAMAGGTEANKNTDEHPTGEAAGLKSTGLEENSETPKRAELPSTTDMEDKDKYPTPSEGLETAAPKTIAETAAQLGLIVQPINTLGADMAVERELGSDITGTGTGRLGVAVLTTDNKDSDIAATLENETSDSTASKEHDDEDFPSSLDEKEDIVDDDATGVEETLEDKDASSKMATENGEERSGKAPSEAMVDKMGPSPRPRTTSNVVFTMGNDGDERIQITTTTNNVARLPAAGPSTTVTLTTTTTATTTAAMSSGSKVAERLTRSASDKGDKLKTAPNDEFVYDSLNSKNCIFVDGVYIQNPDYKPTAKDRQSYYLDKDESLVYHPKYSQGGMGGIDYFVSPVGVATPKKRKQSLTSLGITPDSQKALREVLSRPDLKALPRKVLNSAIKNVSDKINPRKKHKPNPSSGDESEE